jgi:PPK2 family polyphosphate:nucleotide phosphotransferase
MKNIVKEFCVTEGSEIKLRKRPTQVAPLYRSKQEYKKLLEQHVEHLSEQQQLLYSSNTYAVLLIFQAMDAAGKDGVIKHVMSGVNPQGCAVHSFKAPSSEELAHDFLWRTGKALPERGHLGIFNRSHYEEVLVVRVHPEMLDKQNLPPALTAKNIWQQRFKDIRGFEHHLAHSGTLVLKFHLRISKEEQRKRFLARLDEPAKHWKFSANDIAERAHWDAYMAAFQDMIRETSTDYAPWFVVPSDHKHVAWLIVSAAIVDALEKLKLEYPTVTGDALKELKAAGRALRAEAKH